MTPRAVVFTDIVGSSLKWQQHPKAMETHLLQHIQQVNRLVEVHHGEILELIGDSFLIYFSQPNAVFQSVKFAADLQTELTEKPLVFSDLDTLQIRIGISFGPVGERVNHLQKCQLKSIFGNTVNTASRFESKVCPAGGLAFGWSQKVKITKSVFSQLLSILKDRKFLYEVRGYNSHCLEHHSFHGVHVHCDSIEKLKGVAPVLSVVTKKL